MPHAVATTTARDLWRALEPYHASIYFAEEASEEYAAAGLRGGWMGYFASRSACMGPVPAEVVVATFHNFAPPMVRRAIPDAWSFSTPERVLEARLRVAARVLERLLGDGARSDGIVEAARLARTAAAACDPAGRPISAAQSRLPWPDDPALELWQAATVLREHRFDGHVATLVVEGVDGCQAHVLFSAASGIPAELLRRFRGWSEEEWARAEETLRGRGWLDAEGNLEAEGAAAHAAIEERTDACAAPPYAALGPAGVERLLTLMRPVAETIMRIGGVPPISPLGRLQPS